MEERLDQGRLPAHHRHRNLAGKWALRQQMNIPVCFSEHTNNSEQLIPQSLTAINISLMAL